MLSLLGFSCCLLPCCGLVVEVAVAVAAVVVVVVVAVVVVVIVVAVLAVAIEVVIVVVVVAARRKTRAAVASFPNAQVPLVPCCLAPARPTTLSLPLHTFNASVCLPNTNVFAFSSSLIFNSRTHSSFQRNLVP